MGESRNAYRVLVGRPERKRPLGRPRRRWEDNIKMDLREVRYDDRDWINLAQDRDQWRAYVRAAMNLGFLKSQSLNHFQIYSNRMLNATFALKNQTTTLPHKTDFRMSTDARHMPIYSMNGSMFIGDPIEPMGMHVTYIFNFCLRATTLFESIDYFSVLDDAGKLTVTCRFEFVLDVMVTVRDDDVPYRATRGDCFRGGSKNMELAL
ncbi:hypothetical protein ANN_20447 [Periplaneta americana]|uniref:Uncharacterized protein n=1 Tax=Periplaneta americana TaxID=6978 RepID=A0ABQ8SDR7_PERAM|nr:hypothetical protein ANN_20447 [Periplaneta americana]